MGVVDIRGLEPGSTVTFSWPQFPSVINGETSLTSRLIREKHFGKQMENTNTVGGVPLEVKSLGYSTRGQQGVHQARETQHRSKGCGRGSAGTQVECVSPL